MGGCPPVHRAGARATIMAPPAERLAAMAPTLPGSTGRVGAAVLQPTSLEHCWFQRGLADDVLLASQLEVSCIHDSFNA